MLDRSLENFLRVFGLLIITIIPTLSIYLLLANFVDQAKLEGQILGYTISFAGPIAFYTFIILLFRNWAITSNADRHQEISSQEELELLSDYEKTRLVHEIEGEISILEQQRNYLKAMLNDREAIDLPEITQVRIADSN